VNQKTKNILQKSLTIIIPGIIFILWDTWVIYPVKLLVVLLHEISHGIASVMSGGVIKSIEISYELGGVCKSQGGVPFIVAFAGYPGSVIWGSLIFLSADYPKYGKYFLSALAAIFIFVTANYITGAPGIIISLSFSIIFWVAPRYLNRTYNHLFFRILGLSSVFYAFLDIKQDLFYAGYRETDAELLESITGISAWFWGILWLSISAGVIYFLFTKTKEYKF